MGPNNVSKKLLCFDKMKPFLKNCALRNRIAAFKTGLEVLEGSNVSKAGRFNQDFALSGE